MISSIISRLTMKKYGFAFTDQVNGQPVYYWIDCFDKSWMAHKKGLFAFRVRRTA